MPLNYIYIKEYGILKNADLNFGGRFHFTMSVETAGYCLHISNNQKTLPSNFYPWNNVKSMSALVGSNGSGKTSVARCIAGILAGKLKNYLMVFTYNEHLYYAHNLSHLKIKTEGNDASIEEWKKTIPAKLVYFTNYYSPAQIGVGDTRSTFDISTTTLLKRAGRNNPLIKHQQNEIHNMLGFILELRKRQNNYTFINEDSADGNAHYPEHVVMLLDASVKRRQLQYAKNFLDESIMKRFSSIYKTLCGRNYKVSLYGNIFIHTLCAILQDMDVSNVGVFKEFLVILEQYAQNLHLDEEHKIELVVNDFCYRCYNLNATRFSKLSPQLVNLGESMETIHRLITNLPNGVSYTSANRIYFEGYEEDALIWYSQFMDAYQMVATSDSIWKCEIEPPMSSGEVSLLTLFSRLWSLHPKTDFTELNDKELWLYFDEIEITVEPEMQRRLVKNIGDFCSEFFESIPIHAVFSSHSPLLLSDIPLTNVILLKRDGRETNVVDNNTLQLHNTFGANIYSLYKHSFFLNELQGAFALFVIENIIEDLFTLESELHPTDGDANIRLALANHSIDCEQLAQRIQLIGEPIIRKQLEDRLRWIQARLNRHGSN